MLRSLFAHFEAREAEKPPAPDGFGSAPARHELRWVTAGRVAVAVALVAAAVLLFVGPDLPGTAVTAALIALILAVMVLVARGAVALSRLAAVERDEASGD